MGLFEKINQKLDEKAQTFAESILLPNEEIKDFMRSINDFIAVTDKRLILCDEEFDWGDSKRAIFSVKHQHITSLSLTNPLHSAFKKYHVGVHIGSLTIKISFHKMEEAQKAYNLISSLIY